MNNESPLRLGFEKMFVECTVFKLFDPVTFVPFVAVTVSVLIGIVVRQILANIDVSMSMIWWDLKRHLIYKIFCVQRVEALFPTNNNLRQVKLFWRMLRRCRRDAAAVSYDVILSANKSYFTIKDLGYLIRIICAAGSSKPPQNNKESLSPPVLHNIVEWNSKKDHLGSLND